MKYLRIALLSLAIHGSFVASGQNSVVINEVYGGGGNSGSTYRNDFVELYNPTGAAVTLTGWSIQYAAPAGSGWSSVPLAGSVAPGDYYLIQLAPGSGGTVNLPTPDLIGGTVIAMGATAGKIALVNSTTLLAGVCPSGLSIIDFVGYGASANCSETANAPAPGNATSLQRLSIGHDTNNNSADFAVTSPSPANSQLRQMIVTKTGTGSGIVMSSPAGIQCGASCIYYFNVGSSVALSAVPDEGSVFQGWSGGCGGTGSCVMTMTQDVAVTAVFQIIVKQPQTITFGSFAPVKYGDAPLDLIASATSGLPVSFQTSDQAVASLNGATLLIVGAGSAMITASQPGNTTYSAAGEVLQLLTVNKADQVLSFGPLPAKTFGDTPFILTAAGGGSGLPITYQSDGPGVATISANLVTITGAGTATITANQAGDANYNEAPPVTQQLTVNDPLIIPDVYLTSPADGATAIDPAGTVVARGLKGATNYTIELSPLADFSAGVMSGSGARSQHFSSLVYGTFLYARVKTNLSEPWGKVTTFTTGPPEQFTYVVAPANQASGVNAKLNVSAGTVRGATLYTIELNTEADFSAAPVVKSGTGRTQSFEVNYGTTYYTRVKTDLSTSFGKSTTFSTAPAAQLTFVSAPANRATGVSINPSISSSAVVGATSYSIELSPLSDFSSQVITHGPGARSQVFSGLAFLTTYYSRIKSDVSPDYGPVRSFTTASAEALSYVVAPANNAANVLWDIKVTANNIGAAGYTIQLSTRSDFNGPVIESTGSTSTLAFSGLAYNTKYYSRVTNTHLAPGIYGATRSFTTGSPLSYSYIASPANGAINVGYVTNVTANVVADAANYTIELNPDPDFAPGTSIEKTSTSRTIAFALDYDTKYYTRVKTDLLDDWGVVIKSFTTGNPLSLAFVTSPKNGGTGVPNTLNVQSNAVSGATSYTIELNTTSDFSATPIVNTKSTRSIPFSGLQPSTTYYARVKTNLVPGQWGATTSFTTAGPLARFAEDWLADEGDGGEGVVFESMTASIYPVPFRQKLHIHVQAGRQDAILITLYDMDGKALREQSGITNRHEEIDGGDLSPGTYILKITTGHEGIIRRVIKD